MLKRLGIKSFAAKAIIVHGIRYDYSKVEYTRSNIKVTIMCPEHGEFKQTPAMHLYGSGCPKCCGNATSTTEEFTTKAKLVHYDKYDYSKIDYINSATKVTIICPKHGLFYQRPNGHLRGDGCPTCVSTKLTADKFIEKAREVHGNKYDYSKIDYINSATKVNIVCPKHGEFAQVANNHTSLQQGCPCCANDKKYSEACTDWLNLIMKTENIHILHALNGGEFKVPNTPYSADGYCVETNTIYEFHGDYWHGNPNMYDPEVINQVNYKTMGDLYQKTIERENIIKSLGYNLVTIWENDWNKLLTLSKTNV